MVNMDVIQVSRRRSPASVLQADGRVGGGFARRYVLVLPRSVDVAVAYLHVGRRHNHANTVTRGVQEAMGYLDIVPISAGNSVVAGVHFATCDGRSEERRVGKECRSR